MSLSTIEMQYMDTIRRELPAIRKVLQRIADSVAPDARAVTDLSELVAEARRAADSDSNDYEIAALQSALEAALELVPGWKEPS